MRHVLLSSLSIGSLMLLGCPGDDTGGTGTTGSDETSAGTSMSAGPTTMEPSTSTADPTADDSTTASVDPTTGSSTAAQDSSTTSEDPSTSGSTAAESSSSTGAPAELPDIDMTIVQTMTEQSLNIVNHQAQPCEITEGCVGGSGVRRLLRFDTISPNVGTADYFVGNPNDNPELFGTSACTGDVYEEYANYRLLDGAGTVVATGHKSAFALIDLFQWSDDAGPAQYGFGQDMGISVGWADIYGSGLTCQWVDITGIDPGDYTLEIVINEAQLIEESNYDNNTLHIDVTIQ